MGKLKHNQSGFGAVELILVAVIVILLGVVGWMVYQNQNKKDTKAASTNSKTVVAAKTSTKTADPYDGWVAAKTVDGTIAIKIPANWLTKTDCGEMGNALYLASTQALLAKCNTDYMGEASLMWTDDYKESYVQKSKDACDATFTGSTFTFNNLSGYKVIRTDGPQTDTCPMNIEGTKTVAYYLQKEPTVYYLFTYRVTPTGTDNSALFEKIVQSATLN